MEQKQDNSMLIEALKKQDQANQEVEQLKQQTEPILPNGLQAQKMMSGKSTALTFKKNPKKGAKKPHSRKKGSFTTKGGMTKAAYNIKKD